MRRSMRWASSFAACGPSWTSTTNSSPPARATTSDSRIVPRKHGGDVAQSLVTLAVAEAVVDVLEAIHVEEQHVEAGLVTPGAAHGVFAEGEQAAPVVTARSGRRRARACALFLAAPQRRLAAFCAVMSMM